MSTSTTSLRRKDVPTSTSNKGRQSATPSKMSSISHLPSGAALTIIKNFLEKKDEMTPTQKSDAIHLLLKSGMKPKTVSRKIGISTSHVYNYDQFKRKVPTKIKHLVNDNVIHLTRVLEISRNQTDEKSFIKAVETDIKNNSNGNIEKSSIFSKKKLMTPSKKREFYQTIGKAIAEFTGVNITKKKIKLSGDILLAVAS